MRNVLKGLVVVAAAGIGAAAFAQEAPKPGPEQQRIARFAGKWSGKGELKPGPMGPGGPMTWTEECEWFAGGFHLICRSEGTGPAGPMKGLGVIGYDPNEKVYTWYGVDNNGWTDLAKGNVEGKVWTYRSKMQMGDKSIHSRMIIEEISATEQKFRWEMSEDGTNWTAMMEGSSRK